MDQCTACSDATTCSACGGTKPTLKVGNTGCKAFSYAYDAPSAQAYGISPTIYNMNDSEWTMLTNLG